MTAGAPGAPCGECTGVLAQLTGTGGGTGDESKYQILFNDNAAITVSRASAVGATRYADGYAQRGGNRTGELLTGTLSAGRPRPAETNPFGAVPKLPIHPPPSALNWITFRAPRSVLLHGVCWWVDSR